MSRCRRAPAPWCGPPDGAPTVFLLADPGRLYAFSSRDLLGGFGYSGAQTVRVPEALIALLPQGPALDPARGPPSRRPD